MRRGTQRHQLQLITELSITPLLSLVVVLMLVFMLAGPLMRDSTAARLPGSEASPSSIARLTVGKDQALSLEGQTVTPADLQSSLSTLVKDKPGTGVLLQIDRDLPVQRLVDLMDTLRQAGVQKTAVTTVEK